MIEFWNGRVLENLNSSPQNNFKLCLRIVDKVFYFYDMVLLTFNIIAPEIPLSYQKIVTEEELLKITTDGTQKILEILEKYQVHTTFFVEISLVEKLPELLKTIAKKGHELGLLNKYSYQKEIETAKDLLEELTGKTIRGMRQFLEKRLSSEKLKAMQFIYRSPMDFSNIFFFKNALERKIAYEEHEIMVIPESVSPYSRLPYNDFTFQMIPMKFYQNMVTETLQKEEYVMIYLNSWQFVELNDQKFGLSFYRKYNLGVQMEEKLDRFLKFVEENDLAITRMKDFFF